MLHNRKTLCVLFSVCLLYFPVNVFATNGMNMEGYGPISTGMGGASMAVENGTAAVMNNPATLGLAMQGTRLDLALGILSPDIETTVYNTPNGDLTANSDATDFIMPAAGWVQKRGMFSYGFGVFAQGGMGTEYPATSWLGSPTPQTFALTGGLVNRSEVSVGRAIVPLVVEFNKRVSVGVSLDYVWAGMDLQMALSESQFGDLVNPASQQSGTASGSLVTSFNQLYEPAAGTGIQSLHHAYFDFSNKDEFTGDATATGYGGKIGVVFQATDRLRIGASYHSETSLDDLETDNATLSMGVHVDPAVLGAPAGPYIDANIPVTGKVTVVDFQWPATYGLGMAYDVSDRFMIAADVKQIAWSEVMKDFTMRFEADNVASNGGFAGKSIDMSLFQEWDDQTVVSLGGAYKMSDEVTFRAGVNHASNPVPDKFLNPLFPAIVETHLTLGLGLNMDNSSVDFSFTKGLEAEGTNPGNGSTIPKVKTKHAQANVQVMYSYRY